MENPKLSVIIPVWGVEKYIEKCVRSLFESTLEDVEFIFVDDCTPDNSISILERVLNEYPNRKKQVKIVHHEENKGLPQARKTGYEHSCGKWITYCDSDDSVDKEMYSKMLDRAEKDDCDIVQCDIVAYSGETVLWRHYYKVDNSHQFRLGLLEARISNSLCNKIVKKSLFDEHEIWFPKHMIDEDDVMTCQLAYYARKIGYIPEPLYMVCVNPDSMTRQQSKEMMLKNLNDQIENRKWIIGFLESKKDEILNNGIFTYKKSVKMLMHTRGDEANEVRNIFREINLKLVFGKGISLKERLINLAYYYFPAIYSICKKIQP